MARILRKQTHADFRLRVQRVDPAFHRHGAEAATPAAALAPGRTPRLAALTGFGWVALLCLVAGNRPAIAAALERAALPDPLPVWALAGLGALLAASVVLLARHLLVAVLRRGAARRHSAALLIGGALAFGLAQLPGDLYRQGFDHLEQTTRGAAQGAMASAGALMAQALPDLAPGRGALSAALGG
jgi:hypothetical protein